MLLLPRDPYQAIASDELRRTLRAAEFLSEPLPAEDGRAFFVGTRFFEWLTFAGCAVRMPLRPPADGGAFCHVRLPDPPDRPVLLHGRNTRPPRCPDCRAPRRSWREPQPPEALVLWTCPACGATRPACDWDWKESAGCGRSVVWIEEVFPGEASPSPALLRILEPLSGGPWRHCYVQDDSGASSPSAIPRPAGIRILR